MEVVTNKKIMAILDKMIADKSDYLKIDNSSGFMPFNIDYLGEVRMGKAIHPNFAFSHYYKHPSGDMIADPDMQVIYIRGYGLFPYTYQDSFGFQESFNPETGELRPRLQKDHAKFLRHWLNNVIAQQGL